MSRIGLREGFIPSLFYKYSPLHSGQSHLSIYWEVHKGCSLRPFSELRDSKSNFLLDHFTCEAQRQHKFGVDDMSFAIFAPNTDPLPGFPVWMSAPCSHLYQMDTWESSFTFFSNTRFYESHLQYISGFISVSFKVITIWVIDLHLLFSPFCLLPMQQPEWYSERLSPIVSILSWQYFTDISLFLGKRHTFFTQLMDHGLTFKSQASSLKIQCSLILQGFSIMLHVYFVPWTITPPQHKNNL